MAPKVHPPSTDSRLWKSGSGHRPMRMRTIAVKGGVSMDSHLVGLVIIVLVCAGL